ncbi:MAG: DUF4835 family protein [Siphonobacter sp.]
MKFIAFLSAFALALGLGIPAARAQELSCQITIRTDQIRVNQQTNSGDQIYSNMQKVMTDFVNGRRWTNDEFLQDEKINLNITLTIQKATAQGDYEAQAVIQVMRPIYNTSYQSVLLQFVDRAFNFRYLADTPLNYNDNLYTDNLTSLLAFYSYLAIALDYDSFSVHGGEQWVQRAYNVANLASNGGYSGWNNNADTRSRYWLIENLQNQQLAPFREGLYTYYRLAMDTFAEQPDQSRKLILGVLRDIQQVTLQKPAAVAINTFFDAKSDELYQIFTKASVADRKQAFVLLAKLDPTKADTYRKLTQ